MSTNNKPAFPQNYPEPASDYVQGMTLRDYLAGQALDGMIAGKVSPPTLDGMDLLEALAVAAYMLADAMLAEREKEQPA